MERLLLQCVLEAWGIYFDFSAADLQNVKIQPRSCVKKLDDKGFSERPVRRRILFMVFKDSPLD